MNPRSRQSAERSSIKYNPGHIESDHPIGSVDDLADSQIGADAAKHVGVYRPHAVDRSEKIDHAGHRIAGALHQIGTDPGRDFIALGIEMTRDRTRHRQSRKAQPGALDEIETHDDVHGTFDRSSADFA